MFKSLLRCLLRRLSLGQQVVELERQVKKLERENVELEHKLELDAMTMVYNQAATKRRLERATARLARRYEETKNIEVIVALFIDIDGMKRLNDRYGHDAVDRVITRVAAEVIAEAVRAFDIVGRMGGDEFLAIFFGINADQARIIARRIKERIHDTAIELSPLLGGPGEKVHVSVSVGGVIWTSDQPPDSDRIYRQADAAHIVAKATARNGRTADDIAINPFVPRD